MSEYLEIPCFTDAHVHLRQRRMLWDVAPHTAAVCADTIVMPNTLPPLHTPASLREYREEATLAMRDLCVVHVTGKLLPTTTPDDVRAAADVPNFVGWKLYPAGATTNSHDGIPMADIRASADYLMALFRTMEELDQVLLVHGETDEYVLSRERCFAGYWESWRVRFPHLRMTFEHISDSWTVDVVERAAREYPHQTLATITLHHLLLSLDDVLGDGIRPDNYCKPVAKHPEDRASLRNAAMFSALPCFALGSDSAPHTPQSKYGPCGCAGVFSAPVLGPRLVQLFEATAGIWRTRLERFTRTNANAFYRITPSARSFKLKREDWVVPPEVAGIVPFLAGTTLPYRLVD